MLQEVAEVRAISNATAPVVGEPSCVFSDFCDSRHVREFCVSGLNKVILCLGRIRRLRLLSLADSLKFARGR